MFPVWIRLGSRLIRDGHCVPSGAARMNVEQFEVWKARQEPVVRAWLRSITDRAAERRSSLDFSTLADADPNRRGRIALRAAGIVADAHRRAGRPMPSPSWAETSGEPARGAVGGLRTSDAEADETESHHRARNHRKPHLSQSALQAPSAGTEQTWRHARCGQKRQERQGSF